MVTSEPHSILVMLVNLPNSAITVQRLNVDANIPSNMREEVVGGGEEMCMPQ